MNDDPYAEMLTQIISKATPPRKARRAMGMRGSIGQGVRGTKARRRPKTGQPEWLIAARLARQAKPKKPRAEASMGKLLEALPQKPGTVVHATMEEFLHPGQPPAHMGMLRDDLREMCRKRGIPFNTKTTKAQMVETLNILDDPKTMTALVEAKAE